VGLRKKQDVRVAVAAVVAAAVGVVVFVIVIIIVGMIIISIIITVIISISIIITIIIIIISIIIIAIIITTIIAVIIISISTIPNCSVVTNTMRFILVFNASPFRPEGSSSLRSNLVSLVIAVQAALRHSLAACCRLICDARSTTAAGALALTT